jgi:inner membrane protein
VYWLAYGAAAIIISLVRAYLYDRHREGTAQRPEPATPALARRTVWQVNYLLFASVLYLGLAWLAGWYVDAILFIPLGMGALLPGLDTDRSWLGGLLPFVSRRLAARFRQKHALHSLSALLLLAAVALPLVLITGWAAWVLLLLGYASHLVLDLLRPEGVMLLWPVTRKRFSVLKIPAGASGRDLAGKLALVLAGCALALLFVVDVGRPPPPPSPVPSYGETLEEYYGLRGRNQAVASVEGTWQATGRRITDRFEVLNAVGDSYVMLDRFTGKVFTAGRGASDNLYLNRIRLQAGAPIRIQAIEVQLRDAPLADALPTIYQMEREPGLQHIYISGDVVLPASPDDVPPPVAASYDQTTLRRIRAIDRTLAEGHYRIQYLAAADLIELANVEVESADLVIVATYVQDAPGPTPTALPSPPAPQSTAEARP